MIQNRSVPTNILLPHVTYQNLPEAIDWLKHAFGFTEHYRYGGPSGAQMFLGSAFIMVRQARGNEKTPGQIGFGTQSLTIFVDDVEAHYQHAKSAGAKIVEELHQTEYGELQFGVLDLEGHQWLFSRHARDVAPEEWGATVATRP